MCGANPTWLSNASVAQRLEQVILNYCVVGSNPTGGANKQAYQLRKNAFVRTIDDCYGSGRLWRFDVENR